MSIDNKDKFEPVGSSSSGNTETEEKAENDKYCYKCGRKLHSGVIRCSYCGSEQKIEKSPYSYFAINLSVLTAQFVLSIIGLVISFYVVIFLFYANGTVTGFVIASFGIAASIFGTITSAISIDDRNNFPYGITGSSKVYTNCEAEQIEEYNEKNDEGKYSSASSPANKDNTVYRKKERNGFVTFWLVLGICLSVFGLIDTFSGSTNSFYNALKFFNLMSEFQHTFLGIQSIVLIVSYILLLSWKKLGFWMIVGIDALSAFVMSGSGGGVLVWLVFNALSILVLFGILNIRKNGLSCWEQLT